MNDKKVCAKRHSSFIIGFSYLPKPEGMESMIEDGKPNPELMQMCMPLLVCPTLMFSFNTADRQPPTLDQMFSCVQEGYSATAGEDRLHELYGIFLDAIKHMKMRSIDFGRQKASEMPKELAKMLPPEIKEAFEELVTDFKNSTLSPHTAIVFACEENIICMKMQIITTFDLA